MKEFNQNKITLREFPFSSAYKPPSKLPQSTKSSQKLKETLQ